MQKNESRFFSFLCKNRFKLAVLLILLFFLIISIPTFDRVYINRDEPLYSWQSLLIFHNPELLFSEEANYPYSALLPLLAAPLNLFFLPPLPVRITVFFFSILALLIIYLIGMKIFSKETGLIAMLFLILSPNFLYYSNKAMPDVPLLALGLTSIYFALYLSKRNAFLLGTSIFLAFLIKPSALVFLPPLVIYLLLEYRHKVTWKQVLLIIVALGLLLFSAFLFSPFNAFNLLDRDFVQGWDWFNFSVTVFNRIVWRVIGLPIAIFAVFGAFKLRRNTQPKVWLLLVLSILTFAPFFILKAWVTRYYLPVVPGVALMAAYGVSCLLKKKNALSLISLVIVVLGLLFYSNGFFGYYADFLGETNNKKLDKLHSWVETCAYPNCKLIILGNEWLIRAPRIVAELSLKNPRGQMIVNPDKNEFERLLQVDTRRDYYLIIDERSASKDFWLFELDESYKVYLDSLGFELKANFDEKGNGLPDNYMGYLKPSN